MKNIDHIRHSLAHLLAAAVLELYPDAKPTIGPAIDNGFYYDFDNLKISDSDLDAIEQKMKELLPSWKDFQGKEVSVEEARKHFKDNPFKVELIDEFAEEGEQLTFYTSGDFTDLCRGGHVKSPAKDIDSKGFMIDRVAGAYWRGNEKNAMLTRIYGLAFENKKQLDEYLAMREEAKKRDHRKIGQEQNLFFIDEVVGKGLVMWLPKGFIIRDEIERLAEETENAAGYLRVATPHIAKEELYQKSGHLPYYADSMYPPMKTDDGTYYLRAMNCPHHHRIYQHEPKSYRDLPVRIAEYGTVYRNELSGTLAGLLRVRGLAMNDSHIYCSKDQIKDEFKAVMEMTMHYFKLFGLKNYYFRLSKWDPKHTEKYFNEPKSWEYTENVLREVLEEMGVEFVEADDEAAFYGPKVDVQFTSAVGREESMSTIQLDFSTKSRFDLSYTDKDGNKNSDVFIIHRAPLSTHERFLAFLIEHYAGAFPLWLSPVQIKVLPIGETHKKFSHEIASQLDEAGIRVELDDSDETLGKKIRNWKLEKVPYAIVVGDEEMKSKKLKVESRDGKAGKLSPEKLVTKLIKQIHDRK